jgi:hypothetical protein
MDEYLELVAMIIAPNTLDSEVAPRRKRSAGRTDQEAAGGSVPAKGLRDVYYDQPSPEEQGPPMPSAPSPTP